MTVKLALFNIADYKTRSGHPSLGLAYIASYLGKYLDFHNTKILTENVLIHLANDPPDIIGISSVTEDFSKAVAYASELKCKFKIPIIIGGIHISSLPQTLPDCFDIAVLGEGEETMKELMEMFQKEGLNKKRLSVIRGVAFHENGKVVTTSPREIISDLDTIPFPARDLLSCKGFLHMLTSRGCPYRCSFCSSSIFWKKVRYFSAAYVVNEIKELIKRYGASHISIWDDIFIANKSRLNKIVELIKSENIHRKVSFGCSVRADLVDEEICDLMRSMNITHVDIGLESGSKRILKYLKGEAASVEKNKKAVEILKDYGFQVRGSFMIGSPEERASDMQATFNFVKESRLDGGAVYLSLPLPGTEFWRYARKRKLILETGPDDFGELQFDLEKNFERAFLLTDCVSKEETLQFFKKIRIDLKRRERRSYLKDAVKLCNIKLALHNLKMALTILKEYFLHW